MKARAKCVTLACKDVVVLFQQIKIFSVPPLTAPTISGGADYYNEVSASQTIFFTPE